MLTRLLCTFAFWSLMISPVLAQRVGLGYMPSFEKSSVSKKKYRTTLEMPDSFSLRPFAPEVQHQDTFWTCTAWSCGYAARTICYTAARGITDKDSIAKYAFSPGFIYSFIKEDASNNCKSVSTSLRAKNFLRDTGDIFFHTESSLCLDWVDKRLLKDAKPYRIENGDFITGKNHKILPNHVELIKESIVLKRPVVIGIKFFESFVKVRGDRWDPLPTNIDTDAMHSVCIIGYNNRKFGGSFEVMNSWGKDWGNEGYLWLTYDQVQRYCEDALVLVDSSYTPPTLIGSIEFHLPDSSILPVSQQYVDSHGAETECLADIYYKKYSIFSSSFYSLNFSVRLCLNMRAYAYVFAVGSDGSWTPICSQVIGTSPDDIFLSSPWHFNNPSERATIGVLVSRSPIPINEIQMAQKGKSLCESVTSVCKSRICGINDINYEPGDIMSFKLQMNNETILPFFVDLNQK